MTKLPKNYRAAAEKVGEGVRAPLEALALVKEWKKNLCRRRKKI